MATEYKTLSAAAAAVALRYYGEGCVSRSILDHATDLQTGWVWVCLGGSVDTGWHWAAVVHDQGVFNGLEFSSAPATHDSLRRAIAEGVKKAQLQ